MFHSLDWEAAKSICPQNGDVVAAEKEGGDGGEEFRNAGPVNAVQSKVLHQARVATVQALAVGIHLAGEGGHQTSEQTS